ncbi:hypothetical protein HK096_001680 [Nowakowskiella sp. JEL0078]|nr:hypothetical protein HK096_001680 [Nowakowskiella sp. JEL0078]
MSSPEDKKLPPKSAEPVPDPKTPSPNQTPQTPSKSKSDPPFSKKKPKDAKSKKQKNTDPHDVNDDGHGDEEDADADGEMTLGALFNFENIPAFKYLDTLKDNSLNACDNFGTLTQGGTYVSTTLCSPETLEIGFKKSAVLSKSNNKISGIPDNDIRIVNTFCISADGTSNLSTE